MPRSLRFLSATLVLLWLLPVTSLGANTLYLTEDEVLEMALDKNLGVKIAQADRDISETGIMGAKSRFDTFLELEFDHLIDQNDNAVPVFGTDNRTTNWNFGISKLLPSGTQATVEWRNQRNSTDSVFATLNPHFESVIALNVKQPLMKNVIGMQDRGAVSIAQKNYQAIDWQSQRRISESVFQVLQDYWRWITDRHIVAATGQSYTEAQKFEQISEQKEQFGLHESTDVLAARANRLEILNQLRRARKRRDNSLGRLRRGLDLDAETDIQSDQRVPFSTDTPNLDSTLTMALENRPEYLATKSTLEAKKIELKLARNRKWPELDLLASLELNGIEGAYGDALSETASTDNPQFFIGATFSFPFENRLGRSEKNRAEIEKIRTLFELKDLENNITQNVEEQWREVRNTIKTVQTNRSIEHLQRQKWQEELKKYRTGRSSSDTVIRFLEDYLTARRVTLNSLFNYRMAVLGLRLAQNTLIQ